jgi:ssDNA-binding Zn-finger/Zn-ribbon topoisomerase 1
MKKRRGKYGEFWGCTGYPHCKATMSLRDAAEENDHPDMSGYVRWDR